MALAAYALPFGLRQVKLTPLDAAGATVPASSLLLPASRTFSFSDVESFEELEGDDVIIGAHGSGPTVDWELEGGGISLAVWKLLGGGTVTASGVTPNAVNTFTKLNTDARPYFQVEGRAISDSGGDLHGIVYRCKVTGDLQGEFKNGSFFLTKCKGKGYGNVSGAKLYDFVHNETAVALTAGS